MHIRNRCENVQKHLAFKFHATHSLILKNKKKNYMICIFHICNVETLNSLKNFFVTCLLHFFIQQTLSFE